MDNQTHAKGSCNCGAVVFSVSVALTDVYICHCSICRKSTGSGGIAVTVVPTEALSFDSGEEQIRVWQKPHHDWLTNFCKTCGSPLPAKNSETLSFIPVGLLDLGAEALEVKHHIFVDSKAHWEVIGDSGQQHKEGFAD
jgi:hypothetical protein